MRKYVNAGHDAHIRGAPRQPPFGWLAFLDEVSRALFREDGADRRPRDLGKAGIETRMLGDRGALPDPRLFAADSVRSAKNIA